MKGFKDFVTEDEDVEKTLSKLPRHHQELVKGFKFLFEPHNTLKGDDGHVGVITNSPRKIIRVAAPWRYSREFTVIHEVAHLVYEMFVKGSQTEKDWEKLSLSTKNRKKDESAEELFCHGYAAMFAQFPPEIHYHQEWIKFMKERVFPIKQPLRKLF
jgi:hypothetical protein